LEVPLTKPIRLGRIDPREGVYPDVDLTTDLAMEHGVSREHACIFRRGNAVEVEDLASTNGTMLNGTRLAPYLPAPLKDGDQLQLGRLLIEVSFGANCGRHTTTETRITPAAAH
jgi:pSer/pThr/pTyr-binding forkhead associated (FHA) protein